MEKVYIIVLNYKNWRDTIECLESLLRLQYVNYQIIVVDNASPNNSIANLQDWALGKQIINIEPHDQLKNLSYPPVTKPITFKLLSRSESEKKYDFKEKVIFINNDENRGYSAGNNVGIRYGLAQSDVDFFWILNNDVVVKPNSLSALIEKANFYKKANQKVGIIGGKIMHYHFPERIQAAAGSLFFKKFLFFKIARPTVGLAHFEKDNGQYDREVEIDFVNGACMFVSQEYIEDVGLLSEEYFLYIEEPDWAERGKKNNWKLGYSWGAIIYHKEGGSSGGGTHRKNEVSFLSDFYYQRNKILFIRKFYPQRVLFVYFSLIARIIKKIGLGQWNHVPKLITILFNPTRGFNE